ncbi:MAG: type II toxin-antitoxin system RelE/ParE family toxin [Armatimonadota bacterium]|nr:type II toxin-antitoxin system RelE/ParE family toxin [Armatimonadota bacterium]
MNKYVLTSQAQVDLADIWLHIAEDNVQAADRLNDSFYAAFVKLAQMPGMGRLRDELAAQTLRVWPIGQYLIIYRPESDPLEIVRVVSGYRDLPALFLE